MQKEVLELKYFSKQDVPLLSKCKTEKDLKMQPRTERKCFVCLVTTLQDPQIFKTHNKQANTEFTGGKKEYIRISLYKKNIENKSI